MKYYVIYFDDDGEVHLESLERGDLEDRLNEEYWGTEPKIFSKLPNPSYDSGLLIIKGNIVVPQVKTKVTEWEVE